MTMIRTAAPTTLAVSLPAAKQALRIDGDDMDALVTTWTKGVIAELEHQTGQRMMEQTWEVRLPAFPSIPFQRIGDACAGSMSDALALPHPTMVVTSVEYLDLDGVEQTMAPADYKLTVKRYESFLAPARGASWPATAREEDAVTVTVQCGYGSTPEDTPEEAQLYILARLAEQFDPATRLERDTVQSKYLDGLLDRVRSYA